MEYVGLSGDMGHLFFGSLHAGMCQLLTESVGKEEGKKIEKERWRKYG